MRRPTGQTLLDARPATIDENAVEKLKKRAGAVYAELERQGLDFRQALGAELNQLAGGVAPPSVQAMADIAVDNMILAKAAMYLAMGHLGKIAESEVDEEVLRYNERYEKGARTAAGLNVVTKDQFIACRAMAKDAALTLPTQGSAANDTIGFALKLVDELEDALGKAPIGVITHLLLDCDDADTALSQRLLVHARLGGVAHEA